MIDSIEEEVDIVDRHLHVLQMVVSNEPIGIVRVSNELDLEHHEVRYSLRVLEEANLISPTENGAMHTDLTSSFIENLDEQIDEMQLRIASMNPNESQAEISN